MGFPMGMGIPWESHGNGTKTRTREWEWEGMALGKPPQWEWELPALPWKFIPTDFCAAFSILSY